MTSPASTIIVGVDGSPSSIAAIRHAVTMAKCLNCSIRAVISWKSPDFYVVDLDLADEPFERDARHSLDRAIETAVGSETDVAIERIVRHGRPGQVLVEESEGSRMLILGTRGHNEFFSMVLGSVSLECIAHAHVPVTTVHDDHH